MNNLILFLSKLDTKKKIILIIFSDILIFNFSCWVSYSLRDTAFIIPNYNQFVHIAFGNLFFIFFYFYFKIYNIVSRYFDIDNVKIFIKFLFIFFIVYFIFTLFFQRAYISRSFPLITSLVYFALMVFLRFFVYFILRVNYNKKKSKVIVIGSQDLAFSFYKTIKDHSLYEIVAFFSNNKNMIGRKIGNIDIIDLKKLSHFIRKQKPDKAVIATRILSVRKIRYVANFLKSSNINISYYSNSNLLSDTDNMAIPTKAFTNKEIQFFYKGNFKIFRNSSILISGAGGSIGSELVRQIIKFNPQKIILLELSEINLFNINNEIKKILNSNQQIIPILGDIADSYLVQDIFKKHSPEIVFHAAAIKHVTLAENNISTCVKTNIFGTNTLMKFSLIFGVKKFILISTDKSVNPTNIMGMSKRFAEILLNYYQSISKKTLFSAVRFGNVLNSSGSVFPIWRNQLANNESITITDPNASRYLMSIPDAVSLVLDASILGKKGSIFILDMGRPVKIIDLARIFLKTYGLTLKDKTHPNGDVKYKVIGLSKGEKKFEELFYTSNYTKTINSFILDSNEKILFKKEELLKYLNIIKIHLNKNDNKKIKKNIFDFLKNKTKTI